MLGVFSYICVFCLVGLFIWVMVGLLLVYLQFENLYSCVDMGGWVILLFVVYLFFGMVYYWLICILCSDSYISWLDRGLLLLLMVLVLVVSFFSGLGLGSILMMVVVGVILWMLLVWLGVLWLLVSQLVVVLVYYLLLCFLLFEVVMQLLLYGGFFMFIFVISLVVCQQIEVCDEQCWFNLELCVICVLLVESVWVNECICILCELYDLLGYQLIVLILNLEVVGYLVEGQVLDYVKCLYVLVKLLLGNVCEVVSQLCEIGVIDLVVVLCLLIENVFLLDIQLEIEDLLNVEDLQWVYVLLCCIQEIIINVVCYVSVCYLWIKVYCEVFDWVVVEVCDDGVGVDMVNVGNGLCGMCECL